MPGKINSKFVKVLLSENAEMFDKLHWTQFIGSFSFQGFSVVNVSMLYLIGFGKNIKKN